MSTVLNNAIDGHRMVGLMNYQDLDVQQSAQSNVREVSGWRDAATVLVAGAFTATNLALTYATYVVTPITNPTVWLASEDTSALFAEDGPELASFLELMDREMSRSPDSITAADEAQLDRIAKLVAGVRI